MLGHDDVAGDHEKITAADALQRIFKELHCGDGGQVRPTAITTKGEKVEIAGLLVTDALAGID